MYIVTFHILNFHSLLRFLSENDAVIWHSGCTKGYTCIHVVYLLHILCLGSTKEKILRHTSYMYVRKKSFLFTVHVIILWMILYQIFHKIYIFASKNTLKQVFSSWYHGNFIKRMRVFAKIAFENIGCYNKLCF